MEAYLDNSATTHVCESAKRAMLCAIEKDWGNPSSLHQKGMDAEKLLNKTRGLIAKKLSCDEKEIIFTSGGTEANNLAVFGAARAQKRKGNKLVVSSVEHPSVAKAFDRLETEGFEVVRLPVDRLGVVSVDELEKAIDEKTILVSMMAVNNELGSVEPIEELSKIVRRKSSPALIHVDAVQAFGKIPLNVRKLGIDLMTISSHKIHGPKGTGALFVKSGTKLIPNTVGGEQEGRIRPGTEPMVAIAGFGGAIEELSEKQSIEKVKELRDEFVKSLSEIDGVVINSGENAFPYIVNISLPRLPSEAVLNFLSDMEIYVSSGSACAKGHRSPVLTAAGLETERVNSSIRISLSKYTTKEELDYCLEGLKTALKIIRKK